MPYRYSSAPAFRFMVSSSRIKLEFPQHDCENRCRGFELRRPARLFSFFFFLTRCKLLIVTNRMLVPGILKALCSRVLENRIYPKLLITYQTFRTQFEKLGRASCFFCSAFSGTKFVHIFVERFRPAGKMYPGEILSWFVSSQIMNNRRD